MTVVLAVLMVNRSYKAHIEEYDNSDLGTVCTDCSGDASAKPVCKILQKIAGEQ